MPGEPLIEAEGLAVGYGGPPAISGVSFALRGGRAAGPARAQRRRQDDAAARDARRAAPAGAASSRSRGRCGTVPQTERSRLDYPVSALDVATMGALSRLPWWRRPGRARPRGARRGAGAGRPRRAAPSETFGELSGGQRQRVLIARALVQDAARAAARRALLRPRQAQRRGAGSADRRAARPRGGGSSSPPTTSSRRGAGTRVLCLNRAPGRLRRARRRPRPRRRWKRPTAARSSRSPAAARRSCPPHHHHH